MKSFVKIMSLLTFVVWPNLLSAYELAGGKWQVYYWDDANTILEQNDIYGIDYFYLENPSFTHSSQNKINAGDAPFSEKYKELMKEEVYLVHLGVSNEDREPDAIVNSRESKYPSAEFVKADRLYLEKGVNYQISFNQNDRIRIRLNRFILFSSLEAPASIPEQKKVKFQIAESGWYTLTIDFIKQDSPVPGPISLEQLSGTLPPMIADCPSDYWDAYYYQNGNYVGYRRICGSNLSENWDEDHLPVPGLKTPITENWYQVVYKSNVRYFYTDHANVSFKGNNTLSIYITDPMHADFEPNYFDPNDPGFVATTKEDTFSTEMKSASKGLPYYYGFSGRVWVIQNEMGAEAIAEVTLGY